NGRLLLTPCMFACTTLTRYFFHAFLSFGSAGFGNTVGACSATACCCGSSVLLQAASENAAAHASAVMERLLRMTATSWLESASMRGSAGAAGESGIAVRDAARPARRFNPRRGNV